MHKLNLTIAMLAFLLKGYAQTCDQKAPPEDVKKMSVLVGVWRGEFTDSGDTYSISITFYEENQQLKAQITNAAGIR